MKRLLLILRLILLCSLLFSNVLVVAAKPPGSAEAPRAETDEAVEPAAVEVTPEVIDDTVADTPILAPATNGRAFTKTYIPSKDTYVDESNPATNYGTDTSLLVQFTGLPDTHHTHSLVYFDVTGLPDNAVVISATLEMYNVFNRSQTMTPQQQLIQVDAINSNWNETSVTWNTRPTSTNRGDPAADYVISGWTQWDVTNIVDGWVAGDFANYGILLRTGNQGIASWQSREQYYQPRLTVIYETDGSPMMLPTNMDTWVNEALPVVNYGSDSSLRTRDGTGVHARILLGFDTSYLPSDITVVSATLELYSEVNRALNIVPNEPLADEPIFPDTIRSSWEEMAVTWNTKPVAYGDDPSSVYEPGWMKWDVTTSVQGWISGTLTNYGIQLRIYDVDTAIANFKARPDERAPRLTVYYEPLPPVCDPVTSVRISGPTAGDTGTAYTFEAQTTPSGATAPFTYTWTATGQSPVTVVTTDTTHSVQFNWATDGTKTVNVTVENCGGSASDAHQVSIEPLPPACPVPLTGLTFSGPAQGTTGDGYTFRAVTAPKTATTPVTFTWQVDGQSPVTESGTALQSTQVYTWSTLGPKAMTVTVENCGSGFVHYHTMDIVEPATLPDLDVTTAWYETEHQRIGFLVQNLGGSVAPANYYVTLDQGASVPEEHVLFPYDLQPGAIREAYFDIARTCPSESEPIVICADSTDKVVEGDETNNCWSLTWPCDMDPPIITSGPTVVETTEDTATIEFETNEPCSSEVFYDTSSVYFRETHATGTPATDHSVTLSHLDNDSLYHFYVLVTDASDTSVNSDEAFFETQPPGTDPPIITTLDTTVYPHSMYDFYIIQTSVDDIAGLDRIEFYYGGTLIKTEYFNPGHGTDAHAIFSPYHLGYTRSSFFGSGHAVLVRAVNTNGRVTEQGMTHTPGQQPKPVGADILSPGHGQTVYVAGAPVPAGTQLPVVTRAAEFEWHCTYSAFSETLPPGTQTVNCGDVDSSVDKIELYLDDVLMTSHFPGVDEYDYTFQLNLVGKSAGAHTVEIIAYAGDGNTDSVEHTIDIEVGTPSLSLERTVTRVDNYFEVALTIKNDPGATFPAEIDQIWDYANGFQVIDKVTQPGLLAPTASGFYTVSQYSIVSTDPGRILKIDLFSGGDDFITLPPGDAYTVNYVVLPEIHESAIDYDIGDEGTIVHTTSDATTLYAGSGNLNSEAAVAFKQSDYLIVTNPDQLMYHYGTSDPVKALLSEMARLAQLKRGTLAYLGFSSYSDKHILDDLVEPGGYWKQAMYDHFGDVRKGYMLIVGETEIVGAWDYTGLDTNWEDSDVNYVHYSDHAYANTKNNGAPDLIVGRIIGNTPIELSHALRTSINMTAGAWTMDRSHALLVSGRGKSVGKFRNNVNDLEDDLLDAGMDVTKMHWRDYRFLSSFTQDFAEYDGFAAGDIVAGDKSEMVVARRAGDHFYVLDAYGNVLSTFNRSFDEGDILAVGDVGWDEAAEIIVGDFGDGKIYMYNASGGLLGSFSAGFAAFDGLATGYVKNTIRNQIIFGDASANHITVYANDGTVMLDFSATFDAHDGLATGNVMTGTGESTLDEILVGHDDTIYVYDDVDGALVSAFTVDHNFIAGDRLAAGDVLPPPRNAPSPYPPDEIIIGDRNDYIYIYNWEGAQRNAIHVGEFEYYDGLAIADVTGDDEEEVLMADRDDKIHLVDAHYPDSATEAFKANTAGQDVIYFSGHGNTYIWSPALSTGDFPLNFDNTKPFVFAPSCLTGNYEGNNDHSIAEAFTNSSAAIYIGSTEISAIEKNVAMGSRFFDHWDDNEAIGSTLVQIKRQVWDNNDWWTDMWEMWVYEYNLYGDPKIGTDGTVLPSSSQTLADVPSALDAPTVTRDFHIPMFEVSTIDGNHDVKIPGGNTIIAQGHYAVPYWTASLNLRPGTVVQDVVLTDRSGLTVTTGLSMPLGIIDHECASCGPQTPSPTASVAAQDAWYPELEQTHDWFVTEGENGSVLLTIAMYPFFYNPATQDARFYQDFTFDIQTTSTIVNLQSVDTDKTTYDLGESVSVTLVISNPGPAQDVIVEATVKSHPDTAVDGLPLDNLHDLTGLAVATFAWDSGHTAAGEYFVEVKLRNLDGDVLATGMQEFTLGVTGGAITGLQADPADFTPGDTVDIAMRFANTGTVAIDGTAVVQVYPADVVTATATFTHAVTSLSPSGSIVFHDLWDTVGAAADAYRIVAYVKYNSTASAPVEVIVTKMTDYEIFLPLVIRNQ